MVKYQTGGKPYSEPMMTYFADAYVHHSVLKSWATKGLAETHMQKAIIFVIVESYKALENMWLLRYILINI